MSDGRVPLAPGSREPSPSVSAASGFDPSRGVPRQTLVRIGRNCLLRHDGADCDGEIVGMLRDAAKRVTGGNCMFADDDLSILAGLAQRAIGAGLTDGLNKSVIDSIHRMNRTGKYAPSDSDGSPEGEDALAASSETTARPEGHRP